MISTRPRIRTCRGSTTLLVAGLMLPLLFLLFSVSLDAGRYITETQKAQKLLDEVASAAYRHLPFQENARRAAQSYLSRYEGALAATEINIDGDSVSLLYRAPSLLGFARFFGIDIEVPVTAYSRARGTPFDTLIMLDTSSYLGPALTTDAAWGDVAEWPAASFFDNDFPILAAGVRLDPRIISQQCFNPALSNLKRAAVTAAEYLSRLTRNAVGIGVYPGVGEATSLLRPVVPASIRSIGPGEADFSYYSGLINRNELCAAAAEHERSSARYSFPLPQPGLQASTAGGAPVNITLPDSSEATWRLNPAFVPYLEVRHSLWSEARREDSLPDIRAVLQEVRAQLLGAAYVSDRGGLAQKPVKIAYIFAGDVPYAQGSRFPEAPAYNAVVEQLSLLRGDVQESRGGISLKLTYILFRHPGNESGDLDSRVVALANLFEQQQNADPLLGTNLEYQLVFSSSGEGFLNSVLAPLLHSRRTAILSR